MRQKLTACAVLCLLECILQASVKDRLDFSGSCHFLCTLFSLTFSLWPPCYTTCGVRESPPSQTLLCNPPQPSYLFFILPLVPPPFALTSEIAISEAVLSTFSHPLFFSPPFHPRLFTPSGFSHEACKNTCTLQPFVGEHKCTNAGMSVGPQSDGVNKNVTLKQTNQQQILRYTAEFYNIIPSCLWILVT